MVLSWLWVSVARKAHGFLARALETGSLPSQGPSDPTAAPSPSWVPAAFALPLHSCLLVYVFDGWPCLAGLRLLSMLPSYTPMGDITNHP